LQGSEATDYHKPDGKVFAPALKLLAEQGIDKSSVVYVGEALSDLRAANDAQLGFIAVTQGLVDAAEFTATGVHTVFTDLRQVS